MGRKHGLNFKPIYFSVDKKDKARAQIHIAYFEFKETLLKLKTIAIMAEHSYKRRLWWDKSFAQRNVVSYFLVCSYCLY